jgi:hypothetical protein
VNDLAQIVSEIGALADAAEASRWQLCRAVSDAYAECGPYERGLTPALCIRLRKSSDTIYDYRDAWRMREELKDGDVSELPYSHYSAMYDLRERYDLTLEQCHDWLEIAASGSLSVRDLRQSVDNAHRENEQKAWIRHLNRLGKLVTIVYQDAGSMKLSDKQYNRIRRINKLVGGWIAAWMTLPEASV